jgi:hypothetical protein
MINIYHNLRMTELQTRFPITFAKCDAHIKKYRKIEPNIITNKGITYDKSVIPILTDDEIEYFIDLQIKYPEIINKCFINLIELLEQQENQQTKIITRKNKRLIAQNNPMTQIYDLLVNTNEQTNLEMIDKWVLFIKSQKEFRKFF